MNQATSNQPRSLREEKRLRTNAAIQDHATRLVVEHGFDKVTVDDICRAVGISPRTFFNYFPSKDVAVMGSEPPMPGDEVFEWFSGQHHSVSHEKVLTFRVLALMFHIVSVDLRGEGVSSEIIKRRRIIRDENPELARSYFAKFHARSEHLEKKLVQFLVDNPEFRRLSAPESGSAALPVEREAELVVATVLAALNTGFTLWQCEELTNPQEALDYCRDALRSMTELLR